MLLMNTCYNCRAQVANGDRFCGNCGISLATFVTPETPHLPYSPQRPEQQPAYRQQYKGNQYPPYQQASECGNTRVSPQQYQHVNRGAIPRQKNSPRNTTITPMRAEISRLLLEFFNRQN